MRNNMIKNVRAFSANSFLDFVINRGNYALRVPGKWWHASSWWNDKNWFKKENKKIILITEYEEIVKFCSPFIFRFELFLLSTLMYIWEIKGTLSLSSESLNI